MPNLNSDDEERKSLKEIGEFIKNKIRNIKDRQGIKEAKNTKDQTTINIAILGAQGTKDANNNDQKKRDPDFFKKYWRIMFGFRYKDESGKMVRFTGLKHDDLTKDIIFEPIDIFHDRLKEGFKAEECLKNRLNELENPKLQKSFVPSLLVMLTCWSMFNNISRSLRKSGLFSEIIAREDLKRITGKFDAKLSEEQLQIFREFSVPCSPKSFLEIEKWRNWRKTLNTKEFGTAPDSSFDKNSLHVYDEHIGVIERIAVHTTIWEGTIIIKGLEIEFKGDITAVRYGLEDEDGSNNEKETLEVTLEQGEYITSVKGRSGMYLDQLSFETNKGNKFGPIGGHFGYVFSVPPTTDQEELDKPALYLGGISASSVKTRQRFGQNKRVIARIRFIMCTIEEMEKKALGLQNSKIVDNLKQTKNQTPINQADQRSDNPKAMNSFKYSSQTTNIKTYTDSETNSNPKTDLSPALSYSLSVKAFRDLFLWGPHGSGKSLLGVLWVKQMIDAWTENRNTSKLSVYIIADLQE